jgi:hypothetical protein
MIGVVPEPSVNGVAEETNQLGGGIFGARVAGEEGQELHIAWLYRCESVGSQGTWASNGSGGYFDT